MSRRPACHAPHRGTSGSLLLMMLVAVSVVTLLALALGGWIRAQAAALEANRYRREVRNGTRQAALRWLAEHDGPHALAVGRAHVNAWARHMREQDAPRMAPTTPGASP